ncbi:MAG: efflux transporter outer membrane subunit [Alistipes sp.]|nr:efflux transporter outer membrane subunit [Alistipes sp.]
MKKIMILCAAVVFTACGIYKPYSRPDDIRTDGLYGSAESSDTTSLGDLRWTEVFTDPQLQTLIRTGLANNTDMQAAHLRVEQAKAALSSARLSYLPMFNFAPQGALSSFDNSKFTKTYNLPLTASWEIDIFNGLTNAKRRAKALYVQSQAYEQAVQTQLVAGIANLYYTLLMLDSQYEVSLQTADKWHESVRTMRNMKEAGMTNEAGVAQYEANSLAIQASLHDLEYSIREVENTLSSLLGETPHAIVRGRLDAQQLPEKLLVGVPVQLLANRPDVRAAELSLAVAYYATASARSALYPKITLSGAAGWTNSAGSMIVNPGKLLLSAAGTLVLPLLNARAGRAQVKIAKAEQETAKLNFQQTLLDAGAEVNNALMQCQTARAKSRLRKSQVEALERAVKSSELLMQYTPTTYLEVLTAQQSLLAAQLSQISDRFSEIQGVITLYRALGGGRDASAE